MQPDELRAIRAGLGLSQAKLARVLGVGLGTLCGWEQGRRAAPEPVARILRLMALDFGLVVRMLDEGLKPLYGPGEAGAGLQPA